MDSFILNTDKRIDRLEFMFQSVDLFYGQSAYEDSMCLQVPGATPMFFNGPYGRPYEIRTWLSQRPEVESFVILDDETFWLWNWLEHNFVCTTVRNEDGRETIGLDEKGARRAVGILNRKLKYTDTRQTRGIF